MLQFPRRAFTLVELLVVLSIIALLIALLLPALKNARDVAKSVKCASNMRQLGIAQFAYAADNGGVMRPGWWAGDGGGIAPDPPKRMQEWFTHFTYGGYFSGGYIHQNDRFHWKNRMPPALACPEADNANERLDEGWRMNNGPSNTFSANGRTRVSYMMAERVAGQGPVVFSSDRTRGRWLLLERAQSDWGLYFEKVDRWVSGSWLNNSETHTRGLPFSTDPLAYLSNDYLALRHFDGHQNVLFVDGSADQMNEDGFREAISRGNRNFVKRLRD